MKKPLFRETAYKINYFRQSLWTYVPIYQYLANLLTNIQKNILSIRHQNQQLQVRIITKEDWLTSGLWASADQQLCCTMSSNVLQHTKDGHLFPSKLFYWNVFLKWNGCSQHNLLQNDPWRNRWILHTNVSREKEPAFTKLTLILLVFILRDLPKMLPTLLICVHCRDGCYSPVTGTIPPSNMEETKSPLEQVIVLSHPHSLRGPLTTAAIQLKPFPVTVIEYECCNPQGPSAEGSLDASISP